MEQADLWEGILGRNGEDKKKIRSLTRTHQSTAYVEA